VNPAEHQAELRRQDRRARSPSGTASERAERSGATGHPTPAGRAALRWTAMPAFLPLARRRSRKILIALAAALIAVSAATARLFVWPAEGMPTHVSAIVMLDSPGGVLSVAVRLAEQHRAPFLVVSRGTPAAHDPCPRPIPRVKLICFNPRPATTQGEAEFVGRLASKYHWQSVALVAITPQDSRARLRVERCFAGPVYVVTAPIAASSWPYQIAYEWAALLKAIIIQRGC
jgi:hypothetical protein